MTDSSDSLDRMSRAARTSLFDGVCDPDLLMGLVFSNLMSPALWLFRDKISEKAGAEAGDHQHAVMNEIAHYVNNHFFHLGQKDISDIWGLLDIETEASGDRDGPIRYALDLMVRHNEQRIADGDLDPKNVLKPHVERGKFPEYIYTTLDIIHANRRILQRKKHKPYGITCCADEAILISSLACVLDEVSAGDIMFIGSPEHYTAFIRHSGTMFWFNGKKEFFDSERWAQEVATNTGGDAQRAFDNRMVTIDRVITPRGTFYLRAGQSSIEQDRWQAIRRDLSAFFGVELRQIAEACSNDVTFTHHPLGNVSLDDFDSLQSADDATRLLEGLAADKPGATFEAALVAFRRLNVRNPEAYVVAALREHRAREAAADIDTLDHAIAVVRGIDGRESIFDDRDRLALPDEVLLLNTGTDRDKALLLFALLHHAELGDVPPQLVFCEDDSYVGTGERLISLRTLSDSAGLQGEPLLRYGG
ncbi:MAG: hypothetical protein AAF563_24730 [Pseudomonadota bacterium]